MLSLVPKVGLERLYNYLSVADILKNKQDELPVEEWDSGETGIVTPEHENVRGSEYHK